MLVVPYPEDLLVSVGNQQSSKWRSGKVKAISNVAACQGMETKYIVQHVAQQQRESNKQSGLRHGRNGKGISSPASC